MRNKFSLILTGLAIASCVLLLLVASFMPSAGPAYGAPAGAVLTPVTNNNANNGAKFVTFWAAGSSITSDTRVCQETSSFDVGDLQYLITQTGINTVTVSQQYSNNASGSTWTGGNYVTGASFLSGTPVPASTPFTNMQQTALFGRYNCLLVDVTNATPISVYASMMAK